MCRPELKGSGKIILLTGIDSPTVHKYIYWCSSSRAAVYVLQDSQVYRASFIVPIRWVQYTSILEAHTSNVSTVSLE